MTIYDVRDYLDPDRPREIDSMEKFIRICLNGHAHFKVKSKSGNTIYYRITVWHNYMKIRPYDNTVDEDFKDKQIELENDAYLALLYAYWKDSNIDILNSIFKSNDLLDKVEYFEWLHEL